MAADEEGNGTGANESAGGTTPSGAPTCPHCGEALYKRHCKYVCPQHGPIIDCSDPFL